MLTLHLADEVRTAWDAAPLAGAGVAVEGTRVAAVGPAQELRRHFPGARERHWPGVLGPARVHEGPLPDAPSPRERVHAVLKLGAAAVLAQAVPLAGLEIGAFESRVDGFVETARFWLDRVEAGSGAGAAPADAGQRFDPMQMRV